MPISFRLSNSYRCLSSVCTLFLLTATGLTAAPLSGRVRATNGEGLPARLLIVNPETKASLVLYTDSAGDFQTDQAPEGRLRVLATHGPEWTLAETETQAGATLELTLARLIDMPAHGYYGADLHLHSTFSDGRQPPPEIALHCQAEGLQIAALTDHDTIAHHEAWLACANPRFLPLRGQEVTTRFGHILSLGTTQLVSKDIANPAGFLDIYRAIHAQGGVAIVAHPCILTMLYQAPDLRDYDAYEILNGSLPPYGGIFDALQARRAWHTLLNQGFFVPAVGNSDNHDNYNTLGRYLLQNPDKAAEIEPRAALVLKLVDIEKTLVPWGWKGLHPGFYRTYLQLLALTPEAVWQALRAGRGFVTNGPLLLATLDGQPPGSQIALNGRNALAFHAQLFANRPLERLEIIVNGQKALTLSTNASAISATIPLQAGDWLTAELYGPWPEFATTNAWRIK